ncbi:hypothetical protein [Pseudobacteriovorax antillogorgiicola]|uniref:Uncharacterized protein n=1 Tax=Pseudobacteriovorax antillogorgiicola TaxID=1513793 RepID=A0A1Y6B9A7_9BACT|nr:hypothetical protein [Pseudobacteriovorax antillogorgiicola]TCS58732.1 hypothetical protein EDD56_102246 [Pseudobacteriovorax antillogorgiicola]SME95303.1 hypothetical protein SAMN06296036_102197 [Pseudobacteriovorax antillogorgiicola]
MYLVALIYIIIYALSALYLLFDLITVRNFWLSNVSAEHLDNMKPFLTLLLSSLLGSASLGIQAIFHFQVTSKLDNKHLLGYFLCPLLGSILSFFIFSLIHTGLIALSGESTSSSASQYSLIVIGFISGYGWDPVLTKLQKLVFEVLGVEFSTFDKYASNEEAADGKSN